MQSTPKIRVIKNFYEHGKIERIFYIVDDSIMRIRAFAYDGSESEIVEENLRKWRYDTLLGNCYIKQADE